MHTKWQIWDFFTPGNRDLLERAEGVIALNTFDPVCLKLVKDFLTRGMGERILHYKMASEVSKAWVEEEFQTLSLFANSESFFIHQAHDLTPELIDAISALEVSGRFILLSFENELASWKKVLKEEKVRSLTIESPRFWEINKLLDFVCAHLRLPLAFEAKSWILEAMENNLGSFYNTCCLIKLNHPEAKEITLQNVKELLTVEKLDQFQLASLLARRRNREFFERLIPLEGDFEKMRGLFLFLQSHLIKMADPSYLAQKPRLTQYDKELQNTAKLWRQNELLFEVEKFSRWELLSKKKDSRLWHELKESHLRSLAP